VSILDEFFCAESLRSLTYLGWRDELYPIYGENGEVLFAMERSATPLFGVVTYGVHMTVYIPPTQFQPMRIWTPVRSMNKPTYPGMLDNSVPPSLHIRFTHFPLPIPSLPIPPLPGPTSTDLFPSLIQLPLRPFPILTIPRSQEASPTAPPSSRPSSKNPTKKPPSLPTSSAPTPSPPAQSPISTFARLLRAERRDCCSPKCSMFMI
jgi:hypothetical protein